MPSISLFLFLFLFLFPLLYISFSIILALLSTTSLSSSSNFCTHLCLLLRSNNSSISTPLSAEIMDGLGDWELLPDDGLVDFYGDTHKPITPNSKPKTLFQFEDYFSPNSNIIIGSSIPTQLLPVPIHFNPSIGKALPDEEEVTKLPSAIQAVPGLDDAATNQVFFVKMKETDQFVDMKMDSPKSGSRGTIFPQIDGKMSSPRMNKIDDAEEVVDWEEDEESGGVNIWKWSLTGIGALCSFGVAVCIIVLGSQQQNHKARIQIYASDKRIKQVLHGATRLNEVISGTRGLQLGRAHIGYGGYYDAL